MTDQMTVQKQGNYAVPGAIGGLALGGVGGYFADKAGFGLSKAKYTSFDDIIKESKDSFKPSDNASEEVKTALSKLEAKKAEYRTEVENAVKGKGVWDAKVKTEGEAVDAAVRDFKTKYETKFNEILEKAKNGTLIDGKAAITDEAAAKKEAHKYIKENLAKDEMKEIAEAKKAIGEARTKLVDKAKAENVKSYKVVDKLDDTLKTKKEALWNSIKDDAGKIKTPNKWMNALIGAGALALIGLGVGAAMKKDQA